jgi:hypothetical protein
MVQEERGRAEPGTLAGLVRELELETQVDELNELLEGRASQGR